MNTTERGFEHFSPDDAQQPAASGPDARGRFGPGNPGGPGNPYARRVAELRQVMLECVTTKEMEIIVCELMVQAKCGSLGAIKLLFQYVLGKPPATVDPDTLDVQEVEQYRRAPDYRTVHEVVTGRMPAGAARDLLREVTPFAGRVEANILAEMLLNPSSDFGEDDADVDEAAPEHLPPAPRDHSEPVRPAEHPAPSPNGDSGADASRRRTTPPPAGNMNQPAAMRDDRTVPRPRSRA